MPSAQQISVVLPVRNGEPYIVDAVRSIIDQTCRDFEFLLIDDGSTDGTPQILEQFRQEDARIRVLTGPGQGLVSVLNHGISEATGRYVARMDADDIAHPERFDRQLAFLEENPRVSLVFTQMRMIDETGRLTGEVSRAPIDPETVRAALITGDCVVHHPTVMCRREILEKAGPYRETFARAEDLELWLRVIEHGEIAGMPDVLLDYRKHSGQVSRVHTVRQRFSRDLAVLAARARRQGRADSAAHLEKPIPFDPDTGDAALSGLDPEMIALVRLYRLIDRTLSGEDDRLPSTAELSEILDALSDRQVFASARFRQKLFHQIVQASLKRKDVGLLVRSVLRSIRQNPGRAFRQKFRPV
jgi:GT2 family glycosyltransferase